MSSFETANDTAVLLDMIATYADNADDRAWLEARSVLIEMMAGVRARLLIAAQDIDSTDLAARHTAPEGMQ